MEIYCPGYMRLVDVDALEDLMHVQLNHEYMEGEWNEVRAVLQVAKVEECSFQVLFDIEKEAREVARFLNEGDESIQVISHVFYNGSIPWTAGDLHVECGNYCWRCHVRDMQRLQFEDLDDDFRMTLKIYNYMNERKKEYEDQVLKS